MTGFFLLLGHLLGDYVFQNDWMASNKTKPLCWGERYEAGKRTTAYREELLGHLTCTVHCLLYTLVVWACSFWWMPWWGLVACFLIHWPVDRFRLAGWWMKNVSGQTAFATGPLSPWSIILVDNVFHLLTLAVIFLLACGVPP